MSATTLFAALLARVVETLYPPTCPVCRAETGAPRSLCPDCWREARFLMPPGCRVCGHPVPPGGPTADMICDDCLRHPHLWERGAAVMAYGGTGRSLVLALKHGDRMDLVPMLSDWMARRGADLVARADLIVPVPLHWTRRLKRRGNQSAELARQLAHRSRTRFAPLALRRVRRTESQDGKDREARNLNVSGALEVGAQNVVAGKRILLIDDVLTTGATLDAAAAVLLEAGAVGIDILVIALARRDDAPYLADRTEENAHEIS